VIKEYILACLVFDKEHLATAVASGWKNIAEEEFLYMVFNADSDEAAVRQAETLADESRELYFTNFAQAFFKVMLLSDQGQGVVQEYVADTEARKLPKELRDIVDKGSFAHGFFKALSGK